MQIVLIRLGGNGKRKTGWISGSFDVGRDRRFCSQHLSPCRATLHWYSRYSKSQEARPISVIRIREFGMAKQGQELQVPIIDLSPSYVSSVGRQQVADEIRQACLSSGFFYITSHSIPAPACDGVLQQAEHLLKHSPLSEKRCIHIDNSPHGYGWEPSESTSIAGDIETKEAFNRCYSDDLDPTGGDGQYVQLDGTRTKGLNQWPSEDVVPGFYDEVKTYYGQALLLARHLCRLFALSLALPENYFDSKTTHPSANSRMIFYPAGSPTLEDVGLGAHTD